MLPLIPGQIPDQGHHRSIHHELQPAARVAVDGAISAELELPERRLEAELAPIGRECNNAMGEEGCAVARAFTFYQQ